MEKPADNQDGGLGPAVLSQLCGGIALYILSWFIGSAVSFILGSILLCLAPILILTIGRKVAHQRTFAMDPPLLFSGTFAVFFLAGVAALSGRSGLRYATYGSIDETFILLTLTNLSVIVSMMVIVSRYQKSEPVEVSSVSVRRLHLFSQLLLIFATAGTVFTLSQAGGLTSGIDLLTAHNKESSGSLESSFGLSMWQLSALPATIALSSLVAVSRRRLRRIYLAELLGILTVGLVIYGSRLLLILTMVGVGAVYYCVTRRPIRGMAILLIGVVLTGISIPLLAARTGSDTDGLDGVAEIVGYGVFDVSMASVVVSESLGEKLRNPERLAMAAQSVVPVAGLSARELNSIRLDTLVAQYIDGGNSARGQVTGFPPSLPTALLLTYGPVFSVLMGLVFGVIATSANRLLLKVYESRQSALAIFTYAYSIAILFNTFKDGDILINGAGFIKNVVVLAVVYGFVTLITMRKVV